MPALVSRPAGLYWLSKAKTSLRLHSHEACFEVIWLGGIVTRLHTLVFAALLFATTTQPALAQTRLPDIPIVVTSGEAEVKRAADRAWVAINAESRARDPKEAQRLNTEAMNAVMQKLKSMGLGDDAIRTTSFELHPEFDYVNGRQTLRGYVARNSIEVRVDEITRVGEVLAAAVSSGATSVGALRFDLKEREAAEQEVLRLAVANARGRADAAAAGAGMRVDRVLRIDDQRAQVPEPPRPMVAMRQTMQAEAAADVPVTPGNITIRVSVTLMAAIK